MDFDKKLAVWTAKNFSAPSHREKFWRFWGDPASNLEELRKFEGPEITLQPRHELSNKDNGLISRTTKIKYSWPKKHIRRKYDHYRSHHNSEVRYNPQWISSAAQNYLEPGDFHPGYRPDEYRILGPIIQHAEQNYNFHLHGIHVFLGNFPYAGHAGLPEIVLPAGVNPVLEQTVMLGWTQDTGQSRIHRGRAIHGLTLFLKLRKIT